MNDIRPIFNAAFSRKLVKDSDAVFNQDREMDPNQMYIRAFGHFPEHTVVEGIDGLGTLKHLLDQYSDEVCHKLNFEQHRYNQSVLRGVMLFFRANLLIELELVFNRCILYSEPGNRLKEVLVEDIRRFFNKHERSNLFMLCQPDDRFELNSIDVSKPRLRIHHNYNDDFEDFHRRALKALNANNGKGLLLLHGRPGTGKTTYLRYLCRSLKKVVIFLPIHLAGALTSPFFLPFLMRNTNSILVIEDAERVIVGRALDPLSPVSNLLNICDGLLSDSLNIQIICTFNCDLAQIDPALLRKGRLIGRYEFNELSLAKAKDLAKSLRVDFTPDRPLTLAEIYHRIPVAGTWSESAKIGF